MFKRLIASALFAGLAGGLIAAALQVFLMVPVILEAELYEDGVKVHNAAVITATPEEQAAAEEAAMAEARSGAMVRNLGTFLATTASYTGFAFLMVAGFAFAQRHGISVSARTGIIWGLAGFIAFQLAPALGLPAELPGASAAPLELRQIWWGSTVVATIAGIAAIAFGKTLPVQLFGLAIIILPQAIGAPHPAEYGGLVPPELAALFAGRALAVGAATWVTLGFFAGYFWRKDLFA
ncbi:MAG: cobalt transporter [Alphaproteobacteria bacterium]|nr:cobalt transporter [Alphaproteobacteria bacterium]